MRNTPNKNITENCPPNCNWALLAGPAPLSASCERAALLPAVSATNPNASPHLPRQRVPAQAWRVCKVPAQRRLPLLRGSPCTRRQRWGNERCLRLTSAAKLLLDPGLPGLSVSSSVAVPQLPSTARADSRSLLTGSGAGALSEVSHIVFLGLMPRGSVLAAPSTWWAAGLCWSYPHVPVAPSALSPGQHVGELGVDGRVGSALGKLVEIPSYFCGFGSRQGNLCLV